MNKSRKRVLISGGGIAGLAAAWWLERAGALTVGRDALLRWTPDWALGMTTRRFYQATNLVR